MKMSRRIEFVKLRKRISCTGSAISVVGVQRRAYQLDCCRGSCLLRQLVWKFKSLWKQNLGLQRSKAQYSYDLHSYSLNFDDGFSNGYPFHDGSR